MSGTVLAIPITDTIDATDGQAGTYFVPTDAQKYDSPYWRGRDQDWGWTHNPIAGTGFTTATLNISAFDVDYSSGERDAISIVTGGGIFLGYLAGSNNSWAFTTFNLTPLLPALETEINAGLQIFMDIDANRTGWLVTLAKSSLSVDGGALPPPQPGVPDGGSTLALLGLALAGLRFAKLRAK